MKSYNHRLHVMPISDGPFCGSGFGEEIKNVFYRMVQVGDCKVSWFALTFTGAPHDIPDTVFPDLPHKGARIKLLGNRGAPESFGAQQFPKWYQKYNPELVFFMGDPRNIIPYVSDPYHWKQRFHFPLMMYVTLDGSPVHPEWIPILKQVNVLVAMSRWAQIEYAKVGLSPVFVPHGVNWNWWVNNEEIKAKLKNKYGLRNDTVVFINWEIAQHRKRPDALLRCWRDAHPESKNMKLILYTDWKMEKSLGYDIEGLIKQYDVPRETVLSPLDLTGRPKYWEAAEPIEELRDIARLGDVYVSTTSGEGYGKCSKEAQSLSMPVIITDYSACSEVNAKGSILVPTYEGRAGRYRLDDRRRSVEAGIVNEEKFTEAILYLYNNPKERKELGTIAREFARDSDYDTRVIPLWRKVLATINPDVLLAEELLTL